MLDTIYGLAAPSAEKKKNGVLDLDQTLDTLADPLFGADTAGSASMYQSAARIAAPDAGTTNNMSVSFPDFPSDDLSNHITDCMCLACSTHDRFKDDVERSDEITEGATSSAGVEASLQTMANFLSLGYWNNSVGLRHNVGTTGIDANDGVLYYNVSGFSALPYGGGSDADGISAARAALVRDAFDIYEAVLGIDFVETTDDTWDVVDFFFKDNDSGAYAGSPRYSDGTIAYSYINIASSWSGSTSTYDDYTLQTILHELGPALGLGHQGPYNGSASYSSDAIYENDSWQASMMSYFSQSQNTEISADREFLQTPMAVDWLALNDIYSQFGYGTDNAFTEDTTWGFNTTISSSVSRIWADWENWADRTASTIIDAGGVDTLDVSGYSADQKIDLTVQIAGMTSQNSSDIGGRTGNLTLAVGTVIENAVGGSGDDEFIGNNADNVFIGNGGNDSFIGALGNDQFYGGAGIDTVIYGSVFLDYGFTVLSDAIQFVGDGVDLVFDTVESISFTDVTYSYTDLVELFISPPPPPPDPVADALKISGTDFTVTDYNASQNEGSFSLSSDGLTLTQTENAWTIADIDGGITVTENTVLEFDFSAPSEGEIHGIEFDNDGRVSPDKLFQVWGSQNYGIQQTSYSGSGTETFVIPVGQFFTGTGFNLTFVSDDDAGGSAGSVFSNLKLYEQQDSGNMSLADDTYNRELNFFTALHDSDRHSDMLFNTEHRPNVGPAAPQYEEGVVDDLICRCSRRPRYRAVCGQRRQEIDVRRPRTMSSPEPRPVRTWPR